MVEWHICKIVGSIKPIHSLTKLIDSLMLFFIHTLTDRTCRYHWLSIVECRDMFGSSFSSRRDTHGIGSLRHFIGEEFALRLLHHEVIHKDKCHHGFHHGYGAWKHARIVPTLPTKFHLLSVTRDSGLCVVNETAKCSSDV